MEKTLSDKKEPYSVYMHNTGVRINSGVVYFARSLLCLPHPPLGRGTTFLSSLGLFFCSALHDSWPDPLVGSGIFRGLAGRVRSGREVIRDIINQVWRLLLGPTDPTRERFDPTRPQLCVFVSLVSLFHRMYMSFLSYPVRR